MTLILLWQVMLPLITSVGICLLLERYADRIGLMDAPGHRKYQIVPVPRAGGIAIFFSYVGFQIFLQQYFFVNGILVALGGLIVYAGGLYDDLRPENSVRVKLAFQIVGGAIASFYVYLAFHSPLTHCLLAGGFVVVMINSFNLMDNMNGLTAGMALIIVCGLVYFDFLESVLGIPLGAILVGFLFRNFPKGRIFLGDQGSQFLGYLVSVFALRGVMLHLISKQSKEVLPFAFLFLFIVFLPFIADTLWVIVIRKRMGAPIMRGDQNHLSHFLVRGGMSVVTAPLVINGFQVLCLLSAYFLVRP